MISFPGQPIKNKTYSELFGQVCEKNCFYRRDVEMMFSNHNSPKVDLVKLNLEELAGYQNPNEAFKRLMVSLKKWNDQVLKQDRKITQAEVSVHQFVFSSLKTMAFEAKQVRDQNIENLEKWFLKTTTTRKRKQPPTPRKLKVPQPDQMPVISVQTSMRIKEYSRRLLQAHTGILRRKKKSQVEQDQPHNNCTDNIANRILISNLKKYRQHTENQQFQKKVQQLHKYKQRLFQSLVSKKDYVQPDDQLLEKQIWSNRSNSLGQISQPQLKNPIITMSTSQFSKINHLHQPLIIQDTFDIQEQNKQPFDFKPKFTAVQKPTEVTPYRKTLTRVKTADPKRAGKENDASRALFKKKSYNHRFEEIEAIKNKFNSSKTVSHQRLFQGLNEPPVEQKIYSKLPQPGFSLLVHPFFESRKLKKQKNLKSRKKL